MPHGYFFVYLCASKLTNVPSNTTYNEKETLKQLRDGNARAFEVLYHHHKRVLAANILALIKSETLAEEILQEVFLRVWRYRERIDIDKPFLHYLNTIGRNLVYDTFRKTLRDRQLANELQTSQTESYLHVEEALLKAENRQLLHVAIENLPPQRKRVYTQFVIEERSYKEISEELGISKATINEHIQLANRAITLFFSKYGNHWMEIVLITFLLL